MRFYYGILFQLVSAKRLHVLWAEALVGFLWPRGQWQARPWARG